MAKSAKTFPPRSNERNVKVRPTYIPNLFILLLPEVNKSFLSCGSVSTSLADPVSDRKSSNGIGRSMTAVKEEIVEIQVTIYKSSYNVKYQELCRRIQISNARGFLIFFNTKVRKVQPINYTLFNVL